MCPFFSLVCSFSHICVIFTDIGSCVAVTVIVYVSASCIHSVCISGAYVISHTEQSAGVMGNTVSSYPCFNGKVIKGFKGFVSNLNNHCLRTIGLAVGSSHCKIFCSVFCNPKFGYSIVRRCAFHTGCYCTAVSFYTVCYLGYINTIIVC